MHDHTTHIQSEWWLGLFEDEALGVFVGRFFQHRFTRCDSHEATPTWRPFDGRGFLVRKGKKWWVKGLRGKRKSWKSMIWTLIYTLAKTNSQFAPANGQLVPKGIASSKHQFSGATVSGRNPKQPPGMHKNLINGINHQPQLFIPGSVRLIWSLVNQWMKFGPQITGC